MTEQEKQMYSTGDLEVCKKLKTNKDATPPATRLGFCATCHFRDDNDDCHRFPPSKGIHERVRPNMWCGEWRTKELGLYDIPSQRVKIEISDEVPE